MKKHVFLTLMLSVCLGAAAGCTAQPQQSAISFTEDQYYAAAYLGYSVWCDDSIALINEEQGGFIAVKGAQLLFAGAAAIQHHVMISADLL